MAFNSILFDTRNFEYQKGIWETKWNALKDKTDEARAKKILQYSAMQALAVTIGELILI